jgi:GH18 family chitinase
MLKGLISALGGSMLFTACASGTAISTPSPTPQALATVTPPAVSFRVIGYVTEAVDPQAIQYDKLTAINYAFLIPNPDGSFEPLSNPELLQTIVAQAHAAGVKVLISVGGWGWDTQFEAMAGTPSGRTRFVDGLVAIVNAYQLDGADIDWEYPKVGFYSDAFLALMQELRQALPPPRLVTAAVAALGKNADGIPAAAFDLVDYLNLMVYDGDGPNHSSMTYAWNSLEFWLTSRGLAKEKAVLGVPFYARPEGIPYYQLVDSDPVASRVDSFNYNGILVNYNGIPTMQQKTRLALGRASGIMIWNLDDDSTDASTSLLQAIDETIHPGAQP